MIEREGLTSVVKADNDRPNKVSMHDVWTHHIYRSERHRRERERESSFFFFPVISLSKLIFRNLKC
jgi:hypothetical protein